MDFLRWAKCQWDRVAAAVLAAGGVLALVLGALGVRHSVYPAAQLPYMISGGIVGLFCLGLAGGLYLSADMRDEWRKLDRIDESLRVLVGQRTTDPELDDEPAALADVEPRAVENPAAVTEPIQSARKPPARSTSSARGRSSRASTATRSTS